MAQRTYDVDRAIEAITVARPCTVKMGERSFKLPHLAQTTDKGVATVLRAAEKDDAIRVRRPEIVTASGLVLKSANLVNCHKLADVVERRYDALTGTGKGKADAYAQGTEKLLHLVNGTGKGKAEAAPEVADANAELASA